MSDTCRVLHRDRPWIHASVAALCGPLDMPSLDSLRQAVALLSEHHPDCRLAWDWDHGRRRWTKATGRNVAEDIVVDGGTEDMTDIGTNLDRMAADQSLRQPLALIRFEQHLGLVMSHAVGDGRTFNELFAAVLQTALTGEVQSWPMSRKPRFPLGNAMVRTFGREPALLRATVADKPQREVTATSGIAVAWRPARRTLATTIPVEVKAQLLGSARRTAPKASWFAVLMSGLLRGLNQAGASVGPHVSVVVDLRRYLPEQTLDGNFVTGVPMAFDHRCDPGVITERLKDTVMSGRPLATQALAALASLRSPARLLTTVDPSQPLQVTFSSLGRPPGIDALPFLSSALPIYTGSVAPDGPLGLTFLITETSRSTVISASFHDNVGDAGAIRAALKAVSYLEQPTEVTSWSV